MFPLQNLARKELTCLFSGLNSAECYDPRSNSWKMVSPMSTRRSSVGVGVVNGKQGGNVEGDQWRQHNVWLHLE